MSGVKGVRKKSGKISDKWLIVQSSWWLFYEEQTQGEQDEIEQISSISLSTLSLGFWRSTLSRWKGISSPKLSVHSSHWMSLDSVLLLHLSYHCRSSFRFFFNFIYLFWLCWVFVAACKPFLFVVSGGCFSLGFVGFSFWWLILWSTGLVAPRHVESSRTRDQTRVTCIDERTLNHWTNRAFPSFTYLRQFDKWKMVLHNFSLYFW